MRLRTGFSFRTAFGHLKDVMAEVQEPWAPITDRASTFGFTQWTKLCKARGVKPVYGVELAVTPSPNDKKITRTYMTFIARDNLAGIHSLLERATSQFRYEPLLTYEDVNAIGEGVFVLLGNAPLVDRLTLKPHMLLDWSPSTPPALLAWSREKGVRRVASSDNYYPTPDDRAAYEVMMGRNATSQTYDMHILSPEELAHLTDTDAMAARGDLAAACSAELRTAVLLAPHRPASLRDLCLAGADRLHVDLADPVYAARLDRELDLIAAKQYEDYFYIIADLVNYARQHMFVGPARGSSCGSLVCYLLGITTVDPIPHQLLFERFIDITRTDLPDIDIDFSDQQRKLVFDYMEEKYGKDRVARLGTTALYKPKSAINEAGAALRVPKWRVEQFTAGIIERSGGDSRALQAVEDTFHDTDVGRKLIEEFPELAIAARMEGHPRHYSQHAAGVVVTAEPVRNFVAVDARTGATHCDKKDAEALNLLKIDALGLTQLSVFEDCLRLIGRPNEWLINYPLDDAAAFEVLNKQKWAGIFQWNGHALQSLTAQTVVKEFEDVVSITALARPGPLNSGGATQWIDRKNGAESVTYPHPLFEPSLKTSLGIVIYQEQVMQIGREVGGLDWDDVTALRKAMSKSLGKEFFDQYGDKFKRGAIERGVPAEILDKVWDDLCQYGSWAFNRSHSVAYGMVSYWCCVLKAHHPVEFAAATLSHEGDPEKQLRLLREIAKEGVPYVPVDPAVSTDKWQVSRGRLVGPLSNVKGIGPKLLNDILYARKNRLPMPKKAVKLLSSPATTIDELYPVKARLNELVPDLPEAGIVTPPTPLVDVKPHPQEEVQVVVIAKVQEINLRDANELGNVVKRGYKVNGPSEFLNLVIEDDTDRMLARVNRFDYARVGRPIVEKGAAGDVLYVFKGGVSKGFRLLNIKKAKFLGHMKDDRAATRTAPEGGVPDGRAVSGQLPAEDRGASTVIHDSSGDGQAGQVPADAGDNPVRKGRKRKVG